MDVPSTLRRYNVVPTPARELRRHKFAVGQIVTLFPVVGLRRPQTVESSLAAATFEITRLLPEQASSFHYRVKNALTGQERVAAEGDIRAAVP